ncbi:MAG: hypothetical protein HY711_11225 [Candidatus Melainabacteria bacterium]|nr:hypothetical protein [Candidatus Melainabacteria bacterium]
MASGSSRSYEQSSSSEKGGLEKTSGPNLGPDVSIANPNAQDRWQHMLQQGLADAQNLVDKLFPDVKIQNKTEVGTDASNMVTWGGSGSDLGSGQRTTVVGAIKPSDSSAAKASSTSDNLGDQLRQTFSLVDQNQDGVVSKQEVNLSIQDSSFTGTSAQAVTALKWQFDKLKDLHQDSQEGISLHDIEQFQELSQAPNKERPANADEGLDRRVVKGVEEAIDATKLSQRLSQGDLFAGKSPSESIKPAAVQQGTTGDCYFMASVASFAATNPQTIAQMIHDDGINAQGKHTYTVTFPGGEAPVTVEAPTAPELTLYGHATIHGTWPAVLEKAYGEYSRQHVGWFESAKPKDVPAAEIVGEGGRSHNVLKLLTGKDYTYHTTMFSNSESLHKQLSESFHPSTNGGSDHPTPVTLAMTSATDPYGFGLKGPHEYSVVGYDPAKQEVTLRDPRGPGYEPRYDAGRGEVIPWMQGSERGTFIMSLSEVKETFGRIHIASQADS